MSEVTNLTAERQRRSDSTLVTPEQVLRLALGDVVSGKEEPVKVLVLLISGDNGAPVFTPYRSNLSHAEEVGFLEAYKHEEMIAWLREKE
jgi:hypothetical protein